MNNTDYGELGKALSGLRAQAGVPNVVLSATKVTEAPEVVRAIAQAVPAAPPQTPPPPPPAPGGEASKGSIDDLFSSP